MITLLTDFGLTDYFVPAVKGVILTINPTVQIVDLTHDVAAQDVEAAAFTLGACYGYFPPGAIHVAVVDPGVGSARRALIVEVSGEAGDYFFVGPDNGIFSYVYAREGRVRVFQLTRAEYFHAPVSATFHGRDVFAPIAAWLSRGVTPETMGVVIDDYVKFAIPSPRVDGAEIKGCVLHVDRFGNLITNLTVRELSVEEGAPTPRQLHVAGHTITQFGTHYAQAAQPDELLAYLGSAGYWELALRNSSAAQFTGAQRGAEIRLTQ
jgi:S-adenosyl-L-methionine hydrolase (adenosine-forming)